MSTLANIREAAPQYLPSGEAHGLIKVYGNSVPDSDGKRFKEKDREAMKKQRAEDSRMVKVRYINRRGNNERFPKPYCRWDGDAILYYQFIPEHEYEVPKGLVDEVNNTKSMQRSGLLDSAGKELMVDRKTPIDHLFVPVGF